MAERHFVTAFGEKKPIIEWANDPRCPVSPSTLVGRLRAGWDAERAITEPVQQRNEVRAFGEAKTVRGWAADPRCAPSYGTLMDRLNSGWEPERAITEPAGATTKLYTAFGETKSVAQWAADPRCAVKSATLYARLTDGWDTEEAITSGLTRPGHSRRAPAVEAHAFAAALRQARRDAGLSVEEVAERVGVSRATVFRYESGGHLPVDVAAAWAAMVNARLELVRVPEPAVKLAPREMQVLAAIAQGCDAQETARRLGVTVHTARGYRKTLYAALGARSGGHAVALGFRYGLLGADGQ